MGKGKRKNVPGLNDLLERPICYYCDKDFEDTNYLIDHQKAKHFKCPRCNRRLNTAGGLGVHMSQVHKEKLERVENALEGREDPGIEIFGMIGYPEDMLNAHKQRVTNEYFRREAEHRARTGNPPAGSKSGPKPVVDSSKKNESIEDMKKRLEEFKAKKAAEKAAAANGSGSEANTPGVQAETADTGAQAHQESQAPQSQVPQSQAPQPQAPQPQAPQPQAPQPQAPQPEAPQPQATGPQAWNPQNYDVFSTTTGTFWQFRDGTLISSGNAFVERGNQYANYPSPNTPNHPPFQSTPYPLHTTSSNTQYPAYPTAPAPGFQPPMPMPQRPPSFNQIWPAGPTRTDTQYLPTSGPPSGISINISNSPPPPGSGPRQNSLPPAPGLPQRPAFSSPSISKEDMARMHIGQPSQSTAPPQMGYGSTAPMPPSGYGAPGPHGVNAPYGTPPVPYGAHSPQYGATNPPFNAPFPPNGPPVPPWATSPPPNGFPPHQGGPPSNAQASTIGDAVDQLIQSVTGQGPPQARPRERTPPWESNQMHGARENDDRGKNIIRGEDPDTSMLEDPSRSVPTNLPLKQHAEEGTHTSTAAADSRAASTTKAKTRSSPTVVEGVSAGKKSSAGSKSSKHKEKDNVKLQWSDTVISPEEKRAKRFYRLATSGLEKRTETVIDQAGEDDAQAVTGPVDDTLEED